MSSSRIAERPVQLEAERAVLHADLAQPENPRGLVLFAHGSGSSRHSPRNRYVARSLNERGYATLLMDLLTAAEERTDLLTREYRFDIELLGRRLTLAADWCAAEPVTSSLAIGTFGASTGAAAALIAAAERPDHVRAVVSRGGRPDLAGDSLPEVTAPTLLIVGGDDEPVIELNREAMTRLKCLNHLEIVPGATHLFEEPGALEQVTHLAISWFDRHLPGRQPHPDTARELASSSSRTRRG
jgi:putative phosphoribosyl transferase